MCGLIGVALGCGSAVVTVVVFYLLLWLIIFVSVDYFIVLYILF